VSRARVNGDQEVELAPTHNDRCADPHGRVAAPTATTPAIDAGGQGGGVAPGAPERVRRLPPASRRGGPGPAVADPAARSAMRPTAVAQADDDRLVDADAVLLARLPSTRTRADVALGRGRASAGTEQGKPVPPPRESKSARWGR